MIDEAGSMFVEQTQALAIEKIYEASQVPYKSENFNISHEIKVGAAIAPDNGIEAEVLLHCAEAAMNYPKQ